MTIPARALALLLAAALAGAQEPALRWSGVLGQSQPPEAAPLPWLEATGVAVDGAGRLWCGAADGLTSFALEGEEVPAAGVRIPLAGGIAALHGDGEGLIAVAGDGGVWRCDGTELLRVGTLPRALPVAVRRRSDHRGWARHGLLLALDGNRVLALGEDGRTVQLHELPPPPAGSAYTAIGLDPADGALVVARGWPHPALLRLGPEGTPCLGDGWPREGLAELLASDGVALWALGGGRFTRLAANLSATRAGQGTAWPWGLYARGAARDQFGRWWIAGTQGVVRLGQGGRLDLRLGGIGAIASLAAAPDGTLVALAQDAGRLLRLDIAADPAAPLACAANEPWRVGGNWQARAAALAWDGQGFLVAERGAARLWRFDPWHTGWRESTWLPAEGEPLPAGTTALAASPRWRWTIADGRLAASPAAVAGTTEAVQQPRLLAMADDRMVLVADRDGLLAIDQAEGQARPRWRRRTTANLLAAQAGIAATCSPDGRLEIWHTRDGEPCGSLDLDTVPGGCRPTALALWRSWVLVADGRGQRVLRFRIRI
ncbi:MAG: hypothetical protein L6R48_12550 [Planctomycetes bacterium]|nr:hypothetical protein [Planctomycetota bacterium]